MKGKRKLKEKEKAYVSRFFLQYAVPGYLCSDLNIALEISQEPLTRIYHHLHYSPIGY